MASFAPPPGGTRSTRVKNKQPASVQITSEQILREAAERQEALPVPPRQEITDPEEMAEFRMRSRKEFEDGIRRNRQNIANWLRYAKFEEEQRDLTRARSVYERLLDVDHRNVRVWIKYAEFEMRHKNVNHSRNLWNRAVTLLPRQNTLWFRYLYMEQMLENYPGVRQLFERWMQWEPEEAAWNAYIKFELKHNEVDQAREVYKKYVLVHPKPAIWIKWAKFEEKLQNLAGAREVYEQAIDFLEHEASEQLYIGFAQFEERQKEYERARSIYKFALDNIPRHVAQEVYSRYISFEKQFGDKEGIEAAICNKRRMQYEEELKESPHNYDIWFDYVRLEETAGSVANAEEVYERAIAQVPPFAQKRHWKRYIYLWINYAIFEELTAQNASRAREIYRQCLALVPHKTFTFAKVWVMAAEFEIRQRDLAAARKVLGMALGVAPKEAVFRAYVDIERKLGNIDRCRLLFEKMLEKFPSNCGAWVDFAKLEMSLHETERVRALLELAVDQPLLDLPEIVWKTYIDFEIEEGEHERVRDLYNRLLERTKHVNVWISFAHFEQSVGNVASARAIMQQASKDLREAKMNEERATLVKAWLAMEEEAGDEAAVRQVRAIVPEKVKKRRRVEEGMEEYWEYVFPDEQKEQPNLKLLQRAKMWKLKQKQDGEGES